MGPLTPANAPWGCAFLIRDGSDRGNECHMCEKTNFEKGKKTKSLCNSEEVDHTEKGFCDGLFLQDSGQI